MSHWPPPPFAMRVTISSDEPPNLAFTLQPVLAVNGSTQESSV